MDHVLQQQGHTETPVRAFPVPNEPFFRPCKTLRLITVRRWHSKPMIIVIDVAVEILFAKQKASFNKLYVRMKTKFDLNSVRETRLS